MDSSEAASAGRGLKRTAMLLLVSMCLAALAVVAIGWLTNLKQVMHTTLVSAAIFALLPFVLIAFGIVLAIFLFFISLLIALLGEGGDVRDPTGIAEPFAEAGIWLMPRYYRWLSRQRHPVFWGIPAGALLGGLLLWGWMALFILPAETRTAQILLATQQRIVAVHKATGRYPADDHGQLTYAALGDQSQEGVVMDGFGRPIEYRASGRWKLASYELRSLGADGRHGSDDLVLTGSTRLAQWAKVFSPDASSGKPKVGIKVRLQAVRDMRRRD